MQAQHLVIVRRSAHINGFPHQINGPRVLDRFHPMPSKDRATYEAQEEPGGEGWLSVSSVATATGERSVKRK